MTTQKVVFISACVSIFVSLLSSFLNHYLTKRRDRKKKLWELDVNRADEVNQLADDINEVISFTATPLERKKEVMDPLLARFEQNGGFEKRSKFLLKYKGLDEAMDEFLNGVYYFVDSDEIDPEFKHDFQKSLTKLHSACEMVLKGKGK